MTARDRKHLQIDNTDAVLSYVSALRSGKRRKEKSPVQDGNASTSSPQLSLRDRLSNSDCQQRNQHPSLPISSLSEGDSTRFDDLVIDNSLYIEVDESLVESFEDTDLSLHSSRTMDPLVVAELAKMQALHAKQIKDIEDAHNANMRKMHDSVNDLTKKLGVLAAANNTAAVKVLADAMKQVTINSVQTTVPVPKYNAKKSTPPAFLLEIESYFELQHHPKSEYIKLVKTVLPNDAKAWWEHAKANITDWDGFKTEFLKRFDSDQDRRDRMSYAQSRVQTTDEVTEIFIYEMVRLCEQCFPTEGIQGAVARAQQALNFRIRNAIGPNAYKTPEELLNACRLVYKGLEDEDKANKLKNNLPPLMEGVKDHSKGNTSSKPFPNQNNQLHQRINSSKSNDWKKRGYDGKPKTVNPPNDSKNQSNQQGGSKVNKASGQNNIRDTKQNPSGSDRQQCWKCQGFGHRQAQCSSTMGMASGVLNSEFQEFLDMKKKQDKNPANQNEKDKPLN